MKLTDEQIGAELRALRETPSEDFAARLDRRVAAGFPTPKKARADRELTWGRLLPALGVLAAIAVVVVVISNASKTELGSGELDGDGAISATAPSKRAAPALGTQSARSGVEATPDIATPPVPPTSRPRNGRPQVQELSASLGLSTDSDKLQQAADGVVQVTDQYDGFVDSSDVHVGGSNGRAAFSLRIPAVHLRDALDDLSDFGRVTLRNEGSSNVTGAYVDAGKSYRDASAKLDSLLEDLRSASSPAEAAAIRQQLVVARQQLAASRAALRGLKQRVAYAPVNVEIRADGDGTWSIGDAADDAVGVLEAIGGATLIALAVLVPLGALIAIGWLGTRELRRRQREAPLDR
jgi:hypothetical protein